MTSDYENDDGEPSLDATEPRLELEIPELNAEALSVTGDSGDSDRHCRELTQCGTGPLCSRCNIT